MKINLSVRVKNPWFWIGVLGVALTAAGVDPQTFTSWSAVLNGLFSVLGNPVQLVTVALAVLGVFVDPTTEKLGDSAQALTYSAPKKRGDH